MSRQSKRVAARIKAQAIQIGRDMPWSDGIRRDTWQGILKCSGRGGPVTRLKGRFDNEAAALAYAEVERQRYIDRGEIPMTMLERQERENVAEAIAEGKWVGKKSRWLNYG